MTLTAIGEHLGVSGERARQMIDKVDRTIEKWSDVYPPLKCTNPLILGIEHTFTHEGRISLHSKRVCLK